jgi:hypothetical protein
VSGAQHGTSGNNSDRLREIAARTHTTKANVATALQMISWGLKVNAFGNAFLDESGNFVKLPGEGVTEEMWAEMVAYANDKALKKGDYKKLNLPFEKRLLAQPKEVRERMVKGVEDFVYDLLVNCFNAGDTAPLAMETILEAGSYDLGPKGTRIENPDDWTKDKILERAKKLHKAEEGPKGNYED